MRRTRVWIGAATVVLVVAGFLVGVFGSGDPGRSPAASPVAAEPPTPLPLSTPLSASPTADQPGTSGGQRGEPLAELIDGFSTGDTLGYARKLEQRIEANPSDSETHALLGLTYKQLARETGDASYFSLSERALTRAVELEPAGLLAPAGLATLAVARHDFARAEELARQVLAIDPENSIARGALGDALLNLGRYSHAFRTFDRVALESPGVATYARIAHARELMGRPRAAIGAIDLALELPGSIPEQAAWALVQRGNLAFGSGRLAAAARDYTRSLERLPDYVHAIAGLARIDAARGDYDRAIEQYRNVVDRLPAPAYAIALAETLAASGRTDEATDAYALVDAIERLYEANGVSTELQTALLDLDLDREVEDALARARLAYAQAPSLTAEDVLAWALYRNDRCDEARDHSEAALRLGTKDALMFFHRGMIERCLGNEPAATAWFRRALKQNEHFSLRWAPVAQEAIA